MVLLAETDVALDERGVATTRFRYAVRIAHLSARDHATARVPYLDRHERVESTRAWVVRNGRIEKPRRGTHWADIAEINASTVFGEFRSKVYSAADQVVPGDVFAYEAEVQEPLLVAQFVRPWGNLLPVVTNRFRLSAPAGFTIEARHHLAVPEETVSPDGRSTTWTVSHQPFLPDEPCALDRGRLSGRTQVRVLPSPGATGFRALTFTTWPEVVQWAETLSAGQCDSDPSMKAKVGDLIAGAATTLEKIQRIARYVQTLRYVALDKDLGKGAGYKPRAASQVFAQGYGDCKDKANLLRALLREVGVTSFVAIAHLGGDHVPTGDFPSPRQFNHAISAIAVDQTVDLPAVVQTPTGERVLLFDATHPHVLLGDLPDALQGSRVLLLAPASEGLLDVPYLPLETSHRVRRVVEADLQRDGTIKGTVRIEGIGHFAAYWRTVSYSANEPAEYEKAAAVVLGDALRGTALSNAKPVEGEAGRFGMSCDIAASKFLQHLPGDRAVARLDLLSRAETPNLSAKERTRPVLLKPLALDDTISLRLPEESHPEELPAETRFQSDYGNYTRTVTFSEGKAVVQRQLNILARVVPVSEYPQLRRFLSDIAKADRASLLLRMTR